MSGIDTKIDSPFAAQKTPRLPTRPYRVIQNKVAALKRLTIFSLWFCVKVHIC